MTSMPCQTQPPYGSDTSIDENEANVSLNPSSAWTASLNSLGFSKNDKEIVSSVHVAEYLLHSRRSMNIGFFPSAPLVQSFWYYFFYYPLLNAFADP